MSPPRALDEIVDSLLSYWQAEFASATPPRTLLVSRGSDAWMWARSIAFVVQALEAQASQNSRDILPDQASDEAVARFGGAYNVPRRRGVGARLTVEVSGTVGATVAIPFGSVLSWTDGTLYSAADATVALDGSGVGAITVEATTTGASTTREVTDVLTWQSAPAGLNTTGAVTAVVADGADGDTVGEWAQRILARLRQRASPGTRSTWRAWALSFRGFDIRDAWVYPLLRPGTTSTNVLGCATVVCAGPPQGDSTVNTRVVGGVSGATLDAVQRYINGEVDALGHPTAEGEQLRPVVQPSINCGVEAITERPPTNVVIALTTTPAAAFSFTFAAVPVDATSTNTSLVVAGNAVASLSLLAVLVNVGTANYRGGFYRAVLPLGTYDGGTNRTTFDLSSTPLPGAPETGSSVHGCPGCWGSLRLAVFGYFDALGPGVATSAVDPTPVDRWPSEDAGARSTVDPAALAGVALTQPGVLAANVTAPSVADTPPVKGVATLGTLLAVPA